MSTLSDMKQNAMAFYDLMFNQCQPRAAVERHCWRRVHPAQSRSGFKARRRADLSTCLQRRTAASSGTSIRCELGRLRMERSSTGGSMLGVISRFPARTSAEAAQAFAPERRQQRGRSTLG